VSDSELFDALDAVEVDASARFKRALATLALVRKHAGERSCAHAGEVSWHGAWVAINVGDSVLAFLGSDWISEATLIAEDLIERDADVLAEDGVDSEIRERLFALPCHFVPEGMSRAEGRAWVARRSGEFPEGLAAALGLDPEDDEVETAEPLNAFLDGRREDEDPLDNGREWLA
jgi:hypothetical protein